MAFCICLFFVWASMLGKHVGHDVGCVCGHAVGCVCGHDVIGDVSGWDCNITGGNFDLIAQLS